MDAEPNCDAGASGERKAALLFISPPPVCDSGSVPRMGAVPFSPRSGMSESSNEGKKKKNKQEVYRKDRNGFCLYFPNVRAQINQAIQLWSHPPVG